MIVISEEVGESDVYTRRDGFGDLIHQFGLHEDFVVAYNIAKNLVDTHYFLWQGDEEGDPLLEEVELEKA